MLGPIKWIVIIDIKIKYFHFLFEVCQRLQTVCQWAYNSA